MPLTNEDRNKLRDMLMAAKQYPGANLSVSSAMIERILDQEPPPVMNHVETRLEALLQRYEAKAEKWQTLTETATLIASGWEQGDRQRAEKAEAELAELQSKLTELTAPRRCELMDMGHEEGL